jgi:thiol-disulfide isomerase/thioredoxin
MTMQRRGALIAIGATAVVAAGAGVALAMRHLPPLQPLSPRPDPDPAAPDLAAQMALPFDDADGAPRRLADWKGLVLVVNFWATWCPPCVAEMPDLQRIQAEYAGRGAALVGVGIDSAIRIREFRDRHAIGFPLLVAGMGGSDLGRALGNRAGVLPYTVLLSRGGAIVERHTGVVPPAALRKWLDRETAA